MANRNRVLIVGASTTEQLQERINNKLHLLPQYRVVTATSIFLGINIVTTIVLELIQSSDQDDAIGKETDSTTKMILGGIP